MRHGFLNTSRAHNVVPLNYARIRSTLAPDVSKTRNNHVAHGSFRGTQGETQRRQEEAEHHALLNQRYPNNKIN